MGQGASYPGSTSNTSTDFSHVNSLRPVNLRQRGAPHKPETESTMYQSLRSYVGKNAKLPGYMDYLHLSTSDVANLRESWCVLEDNVSKVGVEFFLDILNHHEEIKTTFRQATGLASEIRVNEDLYKHGLYVLAAIKKIISNIDDTEYLEKFFDDLSDKHRKAGVDASSMDVFGKVFCKVMRPILLDKKKWRPEVKDSWVTFFSSIVKVMKKNEMKVENQCEEDDQKPDLKSHVFRRNQYDRHLMEIGCESFNELFSRHPEVMDFLGQYDVIVVDGISVGQILRSHAMTVGTIIGEIQENAGNLENLRLSLAGLGQRRYMEGLDRKLLDMMGPILIQAIRPLVWEEGLWTSELEKAWTHLFDIISCLMKLGYPAIPQDEEERFPNLTEVILLKDTYPVIQQQVDHLTVETFQHMYSLNADAAQYPTPLSPEELSKVSQALKSSSTDCLGLLDQIIPSLPNLQSPAPALRSYGTEQKEKEIPGDALDLIGPVFCNTTRPFLLVQIWKICFLLLVNSIGKHNAGTLVTGC